MENLKLLGKFLVGVVDGGVASGYFFVVAGVGRPDEVCWFLVGVGQLKLKLHL